MKAPRILFRVEHMAISAGEPVAVVFGLEARNGSKKPYLENSGEASTE